VNLLARLLVFHTPGIVRSRILHELFAATAAGFDCAASETAGLSHDATLAAYARFTRDEAIRAMREGHNPVETQARLRREAAALGRRLRGVLGVSGTAEALAVARPMYGAIGVDFRGSPAGDVTVSRCYFSDVYTPDVCRLVSALDEGLLAGLAGGGRLAFSERLTEGATCCRARFEAGVGEEARA
jgi:hypothetical protein